MYGHAPGLFAQCSEEGCERPGIITLNNGSVVCAVDAINRPEEI